MTPFNNHDQESELEKEQRIFREQSLRLINAIINRWFDLKPGSAGRRTLCILSLLILAGFVISLTPYPLREWLNYLKQFFFYLLTSGNRSAIIGIIFEFVRLAVRAYLNPYVLWYLPAFFLPMFFAYMAASLYLADIFELERIRVACKFIRQVALTGSRDVIHINEGKIEPKDEYSPIYKIGGPGKVIVSLESAALFEKVDGHPNVIGPTGNEPKDKATLEGFERFRQAFDLRDQYIDLREEDGKYSAVNSRSLDGIPVTATDVRMMFSIYRGGHEPTSEMLYPFTREAVEQLVYKSTSKVTPHAANPSDFVFVFENTILSMVRRELGGFMSQKKLTEYLANIDRPEIKKAEEQEKMILEEARSVLEPLESAGDPKPSPPIPSFIPRSEITDLFSQFAKKFADDARDKGIELHWIGVGTWNVPVELISNKHLDAWKMSRENIYLNRKEEIEKARDGAKVQKILSMIQNVPLGVCQERISNITDRSVAFRTLLWEYLQQLEENFGSLRDNRKPIPPTVVAAIFFIKRGSAHFVSLPPPVPASPRERELQEKLLGKIGFFDVIEQLIMLELERDPGASREAALEKIDRDWDQDIAGKWHP